MLEVFKQLIGDEGIWIRTKSSNLKERNIALLRSLLFVDALAHGYRTKFPQLTLFPNEGLIEISPSALTLMKGDEAVEIA